MDLGIADVSERFYKGVLVLLVLRDLVAQAGDQRTVVSLRLAISPWMIRRRGYMLYVKAA